MPGKPLKGIRIWILQMPLSTPGNPASDIKGHRMWLSEYVDKSINLKKFYCPKIAFTVKQESGGLEAVIEKIKGGEK